MVKKIYVGNLPFSYDSEKLKQLFLEFGSVLDSMVVSFKDSGKSKGFGFVTFENDSDAEKAIAVMNKKEVGGRELRVNEATPFDPEATQRRPPGRRFNNHGRGGVGYDNRQFGARRPGWRG